MEIPDAMVEYQTRQMLDEFAQQNPVSGYLLWISTSSSPACTEREVTWKQMKPQSDFRTFRAVWYWRQ